MSSPLLADLLARGKAGGYPADIKMVYSAAGDLFNQCPNANKTVAALDGIEFFVAQDHFLTPTARYADIVLPATTFWERNDVHTPWAGAGHYAIFMKQAIAPMYECRNDIDIFADLARRVGIPAYNDKTEIEWLRELTRDAIDDFEPSWTRAWPGSPRPRTRWPSPGRSASPTLQVHDAVGQDRGLLDGARRQSRPLRPRPHPAHPDLDPARRGRSAAPAAALHPKSRARTHSIHGNQEVLARADRDDVWLHTADAAARGIADGQRVRVFNDRGATVLPANVTDRIAPGVVSIREGAWFTPDERGDDRKGCANVLTDDRSAPCGATTYNTCLVQVEPAPEQGSGESLTLADKPRDRRATRRSS